MRDDDPPDKFTLLRAMLDLLDNLEQLGDQTRAGQWSGDELSAGYSFSLAGLDEAIGGPNPVGGVPPAITVRRYDDELILAADLPNVRKKDVEAKMNPADRTVSIVLDDEEIWSVPLADFDGWTITDFSVNNDVLEVRLKYE